MKAQLIIRKFSGVPKFVFENKFVFIISKPAGIVHHSSPDEDGILKVVRALQQKGHFNYNGDLFSVHRLDRGTSGLLLFAKTRNAARFFAGVFADRKVAKYYVAISDKRPRKNMGQVCGDIAPSRRSQMKLLRTEVNPSKTRFVSRTLRNCLHDCFENISSNSPSTKHPPAPLRLFLVKPLTGQRHQVRVVLKSLGSPVLGDPLYAVKNDVLRNVDRQDIYDILTNSYPMMLILFRCYLHACAMRIPMPPSLDTLPTSSHAVSSVSENTSDGPEETENNQISTSFVQIICKPDDGAVFNSPDFEKCWQDWVLPNIIKNYSTSLNRLQRHGAEDNTSMPLNSKHTSKSDETAVGENTNDDSNTTNDDLEVEGASNALKSPGKNFSVISSDETIVWC